MARKRIYGSVSELKRSVAAVNTKGKKQVFGTIAEAAKKLKLDASNISKVLRGKRSTVGGFSFQWTEELPTTKIGREMRKFVKERNYHKELLQQVHDKLKDINQRYRNAKKEKVLDRDPVLQQLMTHADYFGQTKTGLYNISAKNLNTFTVEELSNLLRTIRSEERSYINIAEKKRKPLSAAQAAAIFGTSEEVVKQYEDLLPAIFDLMHLAREDENLKYSDTQDVIFEWLQEGKDREDFEGYLDSLYEAYSGNDFEAYSLLLEMMQSVDPEYKEPYD